MKSKEWKTKLTEMIPCYGKSLITDGELCKKTRAHSTAILKLEDLS
ncbi:MAG: malate:quinone oxidoreductase [Maribacter sp.]